MAALNLNKPIDEADPAVAPFLDELQGNILKGHGRREAAHIFLIFDPNKTADVKRKLGLLARTAITSAAVQLKQVAKFKDKGESGGTVVFLLLTSEGYTALGLQEKAPADAAFKVGMAARGPLLNDPATAEWETHFKTQLHALLIVGDDTGEKLDLAVRAMLAGFHDAGITVAGSEIGRARINAAGVGIEHFGYVDGRSQPLVLASDVERERSELGGIDQWDPAFAPDATVLVQDPGGATPVSFGSLFVFRKLEQDVRRFKRHEQQLANAIGLKNKPKDEREVAGAMVVGRFEDGTPVLLSAEAQGAAPVPNNFNYDRDPTGAVCPFQAHMRKVNPRGRSDQERSHLMVRRGIPYGDRTDDGDAIPTFPTGGVGLLFMAYQADIARQFEFTQKSWANNDGFPQGDTGIDPVIGQPGSTKPNPQTWPKPAGGTAAFDVSGFVTMKGGEYFFAPSMSFLRSL